MNLLNARQHDENQEDGDAAADDDGRPIQARPALLVSQRRGAARACRTCRAWRLDNSWQVLLDALRRGFGGNAGDLLLGEGEGFVLVHADLLGGSADEWAREDAAG